MTEYIPYSIRNNITDPDLAWLLDYLERVMGWEIKLEIFDTECEEDSNGNDIYTPIEYTIMNQDDLCIYIHSDSWRSTYQNVATFWYQFYHWDEDTDPCVQEDIFEMTEDIFFRSYKTLLPVIRDLYSK